MKTYTWGVRIVLFGIIFFVVSNSYFGWNSTPESKMESYCGIIWNLSLLIGWGMILSPLMDIYEDELKKRGIK